MGANAQTSVPAFTAGQVLTAQQQTEINTGIPVFATTTTRDAAFGGTGEKVLAEGQFAYIEASNTTQYYDGAAWQTVGGGLTLIKTQTIGSAVSSVAVTDAFSATYDAYKIVITGGVGSAASTQLNTILTGSTTGYYYGLVYNSYNATTTSLGATNATSWLYTGGVSTNIIQYEMDLLNPFLAKYTQMRCYLARTDIQGNNSGYHAVATSYTGFTIAPDSGTLTGGTIRVYGYQNS